VQEGGAVGWDPISLWKQMGIIAKIVVVILFIMSGWSIGVMIDRAMAYNAARKQSRAFAPAVAGALRDGRIDEAIKVAERNKKSHLAKVVTAGLMEFKAHQDSPGAIPAKPLKPPNALWSAPKPSSTPNSSVDSAVWPPSVRQPPSWACSAP